MDEGTLLKALVNWAHLSAAMLWLGMIFTSPLVMGLAVKGENPSVQARIKARYYGTLSPFAWACMGVLAVTGILRTMGHLENGWGDLLTTSWGQLLLFKLGVVTTMVAAGAWGRYRIVPQIEKSRPGTTGRHEKSGQSDKQRRDPDTVLRHLALFTAGLGFVLLWVITLM